jgi:hypothetical protein
MDKYTKARRRQQDLVKQEEEEGNEEGDRKKKKERDIGKDLGHFVRQGILLCSTRRSIILST